MRGTLLLLAGSALFGALMSAPTLAARTLTADDEHGGNAPAVSPHARAPGQLQDLVITEGTLLRARGANWFEHRAAAGESRFSYNDQAVEITEDGAGTGEFEAGWLDAQGEYVFLYDEEEDEFAYWQHISADTLTSGRQLFVQYCASCHGFEGDGYGRSAQHLRPPPRSFQQSTFKFTKVISDYLPSDESLARVIKRGLDGTPMLPWALSDKQLADIITYFKSISPEGRGWRDTYAEIGDVVDIGEDPYASDVAKGVAAGRDVYHRIGCYNCHPGYVTPAVLNQITDKPADTAYREDLTYPKATRSSAFEVLGHYVQILPPDFTFHTMRSGWTARDVAETVAAGIGGAGMPQWKGSISDDEIWAMGHYVRFLTSEYKDQPAKRQAFMTGLRDGR